MSCIVHFLFNPSIYVSIVLFFMFLQQLSIYHELVICFLHIGPFNYLYLQLNIFSISTLGFSSSCIFNFWAIAPYALISSIPIIKLQILIYIHKSWNILPFYYQIIMSQYLWPIYKLKQWLVELTMIYYVIDVLPQLFCHVQFPTFFPKSTSTSIGPTYTKTHVNIFWFILRKKIMS